MRDAQRNLGNKKQISKWFFSGSMIKNLPARQETQELWVRSLDGERPLEEGVATHSVFLPGAAHGQRSLAGYSPQGRKELDMTEMNQHSTTQHTTKV